MRFGVLGPLAVWTEDGTPVAIPGAKVRALLTDLLAHAGSVVSVDRLVDDLWTDDPPRNAVGALQAKVSQLRRALDAAERGTRSMVEYRSSGYVLRSSPDSVDVNQFIALSDRARTAQAPASAAADFAAAMALWRGDPLGEFADQRFAQPFIARLEELRAVAVEDQFAVRLDLGAAAASVSGLEDLVETYPFREHAWELLVLALYRSGRQADALAALRRVRERLAEDLGIRPGPRLQQLEHAVLNQAPELDLPATADVAPASRDPDPSTHRDQLIARDGPVRLIDDMLASAQRDRGGVVLVSGEAGIGKTRLAQAVAECAVARGIRVAWGRCLDGTAPAFWPWIQILRDWGHDGELLSGQASPAAQDPDVALFHLHQQVVEALTADGAPLLAIVDDAHWADVSSLRLLTFVADAAAQRPILLVVTFRPEPGDFPEEFRNTLAALVRLQRTERVELAPFTADEIATYLRSRRIDDYPGLVDALLDRTGGNPFYLGEVLRLSDSERGRPESVPPGARDVIQHRLARLPEQTREQMRAAAVVGREVDIDLLQSITDTPAPDVMAALEPAVATGLLTEPTAGSDYRFTHALVSEAIYVGLARVDRARLHKRIGDALEHVLATDSGAATLAYHYARAANVGGAAKAVEYASKAAHHANGQLAYAEAVQLWELALASLPPGDDATRCRLLTELGQARRTVGDAQSARHDLDAAIALSRRVGDRDLVISAVNAFGALSLWLWRPYGVVDDDMVAVIENLLAGPLSESDRAALLGTLAIELHYGQRQADAVRYAGEAVGIARRIGDTSLSARALGSYMLATFVPGHNRARRRAAEEMAALPGLPRAAELVARVSRMACLLREGRLDEWDRERTRCQHLLNKAPRRELEAMVRIAETARCTLDARWSDAEALFERYGTLAFGSTLWGFEFRRLVITYTCRRGQGRGSGMLDELLDASERPNLEPIRPLAVLAAVEAGHPTLARELIDRWGTDIRQDWIADFLTPVWGLVAAHLGVPDPQTLYEALIPHADLLVVAGMGTAAWGSTHQVLAPLASRLGRPDLARKHAESAVDTHRRLGLTHWVQQSEQLLRDLS